MTRSVLLAAFLMALLLGAILSVMVQQAWASNPTVRCNQTDACVDNIDQPYVVVRS